MHELLSLLSFSDSTTSLTSAIAFGSCDCCMLTLSLRFSTMLSLSFAFFGSTS
jgi:hypothetical protein